MTIIKAVYPLKDIPRDLHLDLETRAVISSREALMTVWCLVVIVVVVVVFELGMIVRTCEPSQYIYGNSGFSLGTETRETL